MASQHIHRYSDILLPGGGVSSPLRERELDLVIPSSWIEGVQEVMCDIPDQDTEGTVTSPELSLWGHSLWGSQLTCHDNTQAALHQVHEGRNRKDKERTKRRGERKATGKKLSIPAFHF